MEPLIQRKWLQVCSLVALFAISSGLTLFVVQRLRRNDVPSTPEHRGALENIPGLREGDSVKLPKLPSLENGQVDLGAVEQTYLLCVFISTECAGCSQDQPFWRALRREMGEKQVAFYLIAVDADQGKVENFARAYDFKDLPVLFDPQRQALEAFKISFVPQYVLITPSGRVIGRWNGIQRYDPQQSKAIDKLNGLLDRLSGPAPAS